MTVAPVTAQERLAIVTTTTDLRSLAEAVGGDRVAVTSLVPAGFDPEEYQPRPRDIALLKQARAVARVGLDFDLWFDRLLAQADERVRRGGAGYVDASYAIATLDVRGASIGPGDGHAHGNGNPHYWLDPRNADIITGNIVETLSRIDPTNGAHYEANRHGYLARLNGKIAEWEGRLATLKGVPLVAYHNSWAYFARRFRLAFMATVEPKPAVAPSPAQLAALINTMRAMQARILVRASHEPKKDIVYLAKQTQSEVAVLAASVGGLKGVDDYVSLFDTNVAALLAAAAKRP